MIGKLLGCMVLAAALCASGCSSSKNNGTTTDPAADTAASPASAGTGMPTAPPYRLEIGSKGSLDVFVDQLYPQTDLKQIVAQLQRKYADREGGYFVRINCSTGGTSGGDNRLANAKFAVGALGALRTGLAEGQSEFDLLPGKQCPVTVTTAAPSAVTAEQVIDAFVAAGLAANAPRDNTGGSCPRIGCVKLITTEDISIYQFPDSESASRWADGLGESGYMNELIVLRYNLGGNNPTDQSAIPEYQAVLDGLVG